MTEKTYNYPYVNPNNDEVWFTKKFLNDFHIISDELCNGKPYSEMTNAELMLLFSWDWFTNRPSKSLCAEVLSRAGLPESYEREAYGNYDGIFAACFYLITDDLKPAENLKNPVLNIETLSESYALFLRDRHNIWYHHFQDEFDQLNPSPFETVEKCERGVYGSNWYLFWSADESSINTGQITDFLADFYNAENDVEFIEYVLSLPGGYKDLKFLTVEEIRYVLDTYHVWRHNPKFIEILSGFAHNIIDFLIEVLL